MVWPLGSHWIANAQGPPIMRGQACNFNARLPGRCNNIDVVAIDVRLHWMDRVVGINPWRCC
eukprot:1194298-Lingulodinium_polyedra.AAC.1